MWPVEAVAGAGEDDGAPRFGWRMNGPGDRTAAIYDSPLTNDPLALEGEPSTPSTQAIVDGTTMRELVNRRR